jgi:hypothetical protein
MVKNKTRNGFYKKNPDHGIYPAFFLLTGNHPVQQGPLEARVRLLEGSWGNEVIISLIDPIFILR